MNKNILILFICLLPAFPSLAEADRFCIDGSSYMCTQSIDSFGPSFRAKYMKLTMRCQTGRGSMGGSFEIEGEDHYDAMVARNNSPIMGAVTISPDCSGTVIFDNGTAVASKKDFCIALCSDLMLPTTDFGNSFWNCLNDCENRTTGLSR